MATSSKSSRWSEHTLRRRVQFHEVDGAGIVHFSTYFRYMEEAEHALWRAAGLSIVPLRGALAFPRVAASFDYKKPLHVEEEFDVHVRIAAITEKTIRYSCELRRGDTQIATGTCTVVCVSKRPNEPMKAIPWPPAIVERFAVAADL